MPDVGTYRQVRPLPGYPVFPFLRVFETSFNMETAVHGLSICTFWKGRTHLPVRPYIAIIIPCSWRLPYLIPAFR